jgi:hypothetical protein
VTKIVIPPKSGMFLLALHNDDKYAEKNSNHFLSDKIMLIHTCHAVPLPFFHSAVSFVKACVVDRNI